MKKVAVILLLASLLCIGQTTTLGQRNGRFWNTLSADSKLLYILGLQEGFVTGHSLGHSSVLKRAFPTPTEKSIRIQQKWSEDEAEDERFYFPSTLTTSEIVKGVDRFYEAPENLVLPVIEGLEIFAMKANGANQEKVDSKLSAFRLRNIRAVEEEQKRKAGRNP